MDNFVDWGFNRAANKDGGYGHSLEDIVDW